MGPPQPYSGAAFYAKVTRLIAERRHLRGIPPGFLRTRGMVRRECKPHACRVAEEHSLRGERVPEQAGDRDRETGGEGGKEAGVDPFCPKQAATDETRMEHGFLREFSYPCFIRVPSVANFPISARPCSINLSSASWKESHAADPQPECEDSTDSDRGQCEGPQVAQMRQEVGEAAVRNEGLELPLGEQSEHHTEKTADDSQAVGLASRQQARPQANRTARQDQRA